MTFFITMIVAAVLGWAIDRWAFRGEFAAMVREEMTLFLARRRRPPSEAPRIARRGFGTR